MTVVELKMLRESIDLAMLDFPYNEEWSEKEQEIFDALGTAYRLTTNLILEKEGLPKLRSVRKKG
jgi:hypothetical protein